MYLLMKASTSVCLWVSLFIGIYGYLYRYWNYIQQKANSNIFQHLTPVFFGYTCEIRLGNLKVKVIAMYRLTIALMSILSFVSIAEPIYQTEDMPVYDEDFDLLDGLSDKDLAEIDAMLDSYDGDSFEEASYFCLASFRSKERAEAMSIGLSVVRYEVMVRSALVDGYEYYRVLLGPVPADKGFQKEFMKWLLSVGYEGAWLVKGVKTASSKKFEYADDEPIVVKHSKELLNQGKPNRAESRAYPGEESDYNLARLRVVTD